ncbi:MAG: DUF134 domain-containing protein [Oscillospiraceae bacterium]|nr:DUF134 domain-containing protein [Oscillospiraceae bacterium]
MPRPVKCRTICEMPKTLEFAPLTAWEEDELVILTVDEFETICLIDNEGLSQEECAGRMQVARTTVQKIYDSARKKLANALVNGLPLKIEGGEYRTCDGTNHLCSARCHVANCRSRIEHTLTKLKGENTMRIAVTYENGQVFQHFGHTQTFKIFDVEDGKIISADVVSTNGQGHGALADLLNEIQTDVIICGGIGAGAKNALENVGIKMYGGVTGDADEAVNAYLAGNLDYNPDVKCDHHSEEHHHDHDCGDNHECKHGHCGE